LDGLEVGMKMSRKRNREQALRVDHLQADVVGRSVRGGVITFGAQAVKVVIQIGTVVVLSRLLTPQAFGMLAMIAVLIEILDQFKDLGLSAATIQRSEITHAQVTALFWINAAIGAALTLLIIAAAPLIAEFYGQPELVEITRWLAFGLLIGGLTTQHWAILRRQMRFRVTATIDLGSEALAMAVAVAAALAGAGLWALVIQRLTYSGLVTVATWSASGWWPGLPRRTPGVVSLLTFGLSITGHGIVHVLSRNLDQALIGWYWAPRLLGVYERAYKLCMTPVSNIMGPLYGVGGPGLGRLISDPERYRSAFLALSEKLAMATMPAAAFAAAGSDWVVAVLLGAQWNETAPIVAWLAFGTILQPVVAATGLLYVTQNRAAELLRVGLIGAAISSASILIGLPFGPVGVAAALALGTTFVRIPLVFWMAGRRGPVRTKDMYPPLLPSMIAACAVFVTVSAMRSLPALQSAHPIAGLVAAAAAAAVVSLLCFLSMERSRHALRFVRTLGRALRPRKVPV
jgi:polysaccharide transporter, PST family